MTSNTAQSTTTRTDAQSVTIIVRDGDVIAVMNGASTNRTFVIAAADQLLLDGSASYDENIPSGVASSGQLVYEWS